MSNFPEFYYNDNFRFFYYLGLIDPLDIKESYNNENVCEKCGCDIRKYYNTGRVKNGQFEYKRIKNEKVIISKNSK